MERNNEGIERRETKGGKYEVRDVQRRRRAETATGRDGDGERRRRGETATGRGRRGERATGGPGDGDQGSGAEGAAVDRRRRRQSGRPNRSSVMAGYYQ